VIEHPSLSVCIPTFNNVEVLKQCIDGWRTYGGDTVEVIVVEDGCRDGTDDFLHGMQATQWGARHLRWIHEDDGHELRCTNAGIAVARAPIVAAWQDDMFLRSSWLVPELARTFESYPEIALVALSRGPTACRSTSRSASMKTSSIGGAFRARSVLRPETGSVSTKWTS
jgi:glycosyltransferase involved in cell wall biosynthesis